MRLSKIAEVVKVAILAIACLSAVSIKWKQGEGSPSPAIPQLEEAWTFPDFSATQVIQTKAYDMPMKIYRSGYAVRVQKTAALGTLYMPANGKIYELTQYPDNSRQCVVMRTDQARGLPSPLELLFGTKVLKTAAGRDVVEGHDCNVENVTVTRPDGEKIEAKVWEGDDLKGIPVKIVAQVAGVTFTAVYRDVVLGSPNKDLMDPPQRCTPLEKMGHVAEEKTYK